MLINFLSSYVVKQSDAFWHWALICSYRTEKSLCFPSLWRQLLAITPYTKVLPGETWWAVKWSSALSIMAAFKGLRSTKLWLNILLFQSVFHGLEMSWLEDPSQPSQCAHFSFSHPQICHFPSTFRKNAREREFYLMWLGVKLNWNSNANLHERQNWLSCLEWSILLS